jgi:hypothetical protein
MNSIKNSSIHCVFLSKKSCSINTGNEENPNSFCGGVMVACGGRAV